MVSEVPPFLDREPKVSIPQHLSLRTFLAELVQKWQDHPKPNEMSLPQVLSVLGGELQNQVGQNDPPQDVANLILQELVNLGRLQDAAESLDQISKEDRESLNLYDFLSEYGPRGGWG